MDAKMIISLVGLLMTGMMALAGTIAFILKNIEANRLALNESIAELRRETQRQLDKLEADLRASIEHNKNDNLKTHEVIRGQIDEVRKEVEDKISRANTRIDKNKDLIYSICKK